MLYQQTVEYQKPVFQKNNFDILVSAHTHLLEQQIWLQKLIAEKIKKRRQTNKPRSQNSIWDVAKLIDRFQKPEYQSTQAKVDLLTFDAVHHAKEMALVESVTRFSYWHDVSNDKTLGDGYFEDISAMLNSFTQELAKKGLSASRATIESVTFNRAKQMLAQIAIQGSNDGIVITSFPDDESSGYHGVDSKHNWGKPETHHSFFYLLRVGETKKNESGQITAFEINTTQYRIWPNTQQALDIHNLFGFPIEQIDAPVPNLLFANTMVLNQETLEKIAQNLQIDITKNLGPEDLQEDSFEKKFKAILYKNSEKHLINFTHVPKVDLESFWGIQEEYFNNFYLTVALPIFEEITKLQTIYPNPDKKTAHLIQTKVDYLDKAFFYYSKILLGWIKIHNTNPSYQETFKEINHVQKILEFQKTMLFKLLGLKSNQNIPSVSKLQLVLDIDHRIATKQQVTHEEKKKLLETWGFFSFVGNFGSLLQCGTIAPFTMPLSIMNKSFETGSSISQFSNSLSAITIPEKRKLLSLLQQEEYIELDLTKNNPPAKSIYSVPKSYLEGNGCIVDTDGTVLGPCIELVDGIEKRIALDDPRDTLAFPMTLIVFKQYISALEKNIQQDTLTEIDQIFQSEDFSPNEKRKVHIAIKKLRQKMIKQSLGLQEFISGNLVNEQFTANSEWLMDLTVKLAFSNNPVETLITEVETKLKDNESDINMLVEK